MLVYLLGTACLYLIVNEAVVCLSVYFVCWTYLLQEVTLEADEVVGLDDVGTALTAEHSGEQGLHSWRALPRAHHGIGYLQSLHAHTRTEERSYTSITLVQFCRSCHMWRAASVHCPPSAVITVK